MYTITKNKRFNSKLKSVIKFKGIYFLMIPGLLYYLIYKYLPMIGIIIAFKDVSPFLGIEKMLTAPWVGLKHFNTFISSPYFFQLLRNTLLISLYGLMVGFPATIFLALLLNEVRSGPFKKTVQTISYLPHFVSNVVVAGLLITFLSPSSGVVNRIIEYFGGESIYFLGDPKYFRSVLVGSGVWQSIGWGTIIYLAAMAGINPQLYEAAHMEGANRFQRALHITLPGIAPLISILLVLRMGQMLNAGFEKILLLYSPAVYEVGDVIDTFVYRSGIKNAKFSYSTAVGLFKSVIAMVLIVLSDFAAKRMGQTGIL